MYYEAGVNEQDAREREKYLKSGMGKRYLKNRLRRFLSLSGVSPLEMSKSLNKIDYGNASVRITKKRRFLSLTGFTLIEILLASAILAICISGILAAYINMFFLGDLMRDFTLTTNAMQAKTEEIKNMYFDNLPALHGTTFDINGFASSAAKGRIEVTNTAYTDLKRVRVVVCFKSRLRLIGEDTNLNGVLEPVEDRNGNGRLDSPAEIITLIAK